MKEDERGDREDEGSLYHPLFCGRHAAGPGDVIFVFRVRTRQRARPCSLSVSRVPTAFAFAMGDGSAGVVRAGKSCEMRAASRSTDVVLCVL